MPVQVVVGANAQSNAQAFLSAVTEFTHAVQKLQSTGRQLVSSGDWQGKSATAFEGDFQQFTRQSQLMDQSLTKMAEGAKTVITTIDNTDQAGASQIGVFSG
jgi:WXG100 family type VII secretion target